MKGPHSAIECGRYFTLRNRRRLESPVWLECQKAEHGCAHFVPLFLAHGAVVTRVAFANAIELIEVHHWSYLLTNELFIGQLNHLLFY